MPRVADVAQGRGKVARADEERIHAVHGGDLLDVGDGLGRLDLHDVADLVRRLPVVVRVLRAVVVHARQTHDAPHAAVAWIPRRCHRLPRLLRAVHPREDDALRAEVEHALRDHRLVPGHAHHGLRAAALRNLQLKQNIADFVRAVLHVDDEPVEAGRVGDHLRHEGAAQARPQADLPPLAGLRTDSRLESILPHNRRVLGKASAPS
mmetsp:Transcript_58700/g.179027  ORF Transcript_58700/g.179027 Transcript_58700/m.179027 type:complete len:207 (-) Transcript_58700:248-868(-)